MAQDAETLAHSLGISDAGQNDDYTQETCTSCAGTSAVE